MRATVSRASVSPELSRGEVRNRATPVSRLCSEPVIEPRKLAAVDIVLLGPTLILVEFAAGVLLALVLGTFILWRAKSSTQIFLGVYLFLLGLNYVPMFVHAALIRNRRRARMELGGELNDRSSAMAKYRRQSLWLLVPLIPVIAAIRDAEGKPGL